MDLKDSFSEWYSVVDPGFTGDKITRRLAAISKIAGSMTVGQIENLVSVFYGTSTDQNFIGKMRAELRLADDTYVAHDAAELAVVAAGVLHVILSKAGPSANTAALFLLSGEFGGMRGMARVDAVVVRAREYLREEGSRVREEGLRFPSMPELLKGATKKLQDAGKDAPVVDPEPKDVALDVQRDVLNALKAYGTGLSEVLNNMDKRRMEESSVLYWLLGERTLISDERFDKVDKPRLALLAANDLASQTRHLPGPVSCLSVLRTVISRGKGNSQQGSMQICLGKLTADDGENLFKGTKTHAPLLFPISFALEKKRENAWGTGWENAFTTQTKMAADASRKLDEIAEQYYRELLLARLLNEA